MLCWTRKIGPQLMGNMVQHNATEDIGNTSENGCFVRSRAPPWAEVAPKRTGPTWGQVAPCCSQAGPKLEPDGSKLGPTRALVGRSWPRVAHDAAVLDRNGADLQKATYRLTTVPCTFWRFALANMAPRRSCTRLTDRSIRAVRLLDRTPRHLRCRRIGGFGLADF